MGFVAFEHIVGYFCRGLFSVLSCVGFCRQCFSVGVASVGKRVSGLVLQLVRRIENMTFTEKVIQT